MNNKNTLSVLISLFYKEKPEYIDVCLKSLYEQTHKANEIILVKEGELSEVHNTVLNKWDKLFGVGIIRIIDSGETKGLSACLNLGINASRCDYIARFDSDDECLPFRFEKQMAYLADNPQVVLLGGQIEEYDEEMAISLGIRSVPLTQKSIFKYSKWRSPFNHQTVIYKRDVAIELNGYPIMRVYEDYAFWAKFLTKNYQVANLPDILVKARTGKGLISRRSGIKFLKGELIGINYLYKMKLVNFPEYALLRVSRIFVRMVPTKLLSYIYYRLRN